MRSVHALWRSRSSSCSLLSSSSALSPSPLGSLVSGVAHTASLGLAGPLECHRVRMFWTRGRTPRGSDEEQPARSGEGGPVGRANGSADMERRRLLSHVHHACNSGWHAPNTPCLATRRQGFRKTMSTVYVGEGGTVEASRVLGGRVRVTGAHLLWRLEAASPPSTRSRRIARFGREMPRGQSHFVSARLQLLRASLLK